MRQWGWRFFGVALAVCGTAGLAAAEDLVMPFSCTAAAGQIQVRSANETAYRILGPRDEQPFVACSGPADAVCETMMIHRFAIECDGQRVPWSRVAGAARASGVALPAGMPSGFAPVSTLAGRFVLPSLTRNAPFVSRVATQDLSPDSVTEVREETETIQAAAWDTTVSTDRPLVTANGTAFRLLSSLVAVMSVLFAASMVAAGRWRLWAFQPVSERYSRFVSQWGDTIAGSARTIFSRMNMARRTRTPDVHRVELKNALATLEQRLFQVEEAVSSLADGMLLRDVLQAEVSTVSQRIADIKRQISNWPIEKTTAIIRALLRDLDRIGRISHSAAHPSQTTPDADDGMPQSISEAYRILGINADAAPAVSKKLVDALRMSWHPDHARDAEDRRRREARMKQINAAWDMVKVRKAAA